MSERFKFIERSIPAEIDPGRWPATLALLEDRELDHWFWTYRVWQGSTTVRRFTSNTFYYTSGANPKMKVAS